MNFSSISDTQLLHETLQLVQEERKMTLRVLHLLREIEARLLYAKEGFTSLFAYAVGPLGYTEDEDVRRISAMRLLSAVPEVEEEMQTGELKLSQLAKVQTLIRVERKAGRVLHKKEKLEIIEKVSGHSTRETERLLLSQSPALQAARKTEERVRVVSEDLTEIKFHADGEMMELLAQAKALCACPQEMNPSVTQLLKTGLKVLIVERKKRKQGLLPVARQEVSARETPIREVAAPTARYIPVSLKRALHARAQNRCEFLSPDGKRCESQHALELHHLQNYSENGPHTLENLAIYCRAHNAAQALSDFPWLKQRGTA